MKLTSPPQLLIILLYLPFTLVGQNYMRYADFDRRNVLVKTDDDIIESEVYEGLSKKIWKIDPEKTYYWYDHSMIMSSKGGYTGELLDGNFLVQYKSYKLKEQGQFKFGLKHGLWRKWSEDGIMQDYFHFKRGSRNGKYVLYNSSGTWSERGIYKNDLRNGKVEFNKQGDSVTSVKYKNGVEVIPKQKTPKPKEGSIERSKDDKKAKSSKTEKAKENKTAKPAVKSKQTDKTTEKKSAKTGDKNKK